MEAKAIVSKLNKLASDPQNRSYLMNKDKSLPPGLSMFLKHEDPEVAYLAVETFYYLSLESSLHVFLCNAKEDLQVLTKHSQNSLHPNIQQKALSALVALHLVSTPPNNQEKTITEEKEENGVKRKVFSTKTNIPTSFTTRGKVLRVSSSSFNDSKQNSHSERPLTFTIFLKNLTTREVQSQLEKKLLSVNGVISFTCDLSTKRTIVRAKCPLKVITDAIETMEGFECSTSLKDDKENDKGYLSSSSSSSSISSSSLCVKSSSTPKKNESNGSLWGKIGALFF